MFIKKYLFLRLLNKYGLLKRVNFYAKITIRNHKIIIPNIHGIAFYNITEPWMSTLIEKIFRLREGGVFIDVGVNLGQTLINLKIDRLDQVYYGFEPNPTCYLYARELIRANKFPNCIIYPIGLSNKDEVVTIFLKDDSDAAGSLIEGFRETAFYSTSHFVPVFKGDDLLRKLDLKSISVIKIDVEGGELEVIQGLRNTIMEFKPYIICEVLPIFNEMTQVGSFRKKRQTIFESAIKENGYKIFRVQQNGGIVAIDSIETHSDLSLCNYVFVPETEINQFCTLFERKE